jgi:hypothetical protein
MIIKLSTIIFTMKRFYSIIYTGTDKDGISRILLIMWNRARRKRRNLLFMP